MNGGHDLGGMHGFGPVEIERDEPVFHHEWERRAFAITVAAGFLDKWNIDQSRFAREQMPPAEYLATTYYEHWLFGLEKLLHDQDLVSRDEVVARLTGRGGAARPIADARKLKVEDVEPALRRSRASNTRYCRCLGRACCRAVDMRPSHPHTPRLDSSRCGTRAESEPPASHRKAFRYPCR